jgi:AbrB family looped-hinge helix DNA binding protein
MSKARVSSKGQVTIPQDVRQKLGLERGDWVIFTSTDNGVRMSKVSKVIGDLYGSVPPLKVPWKKAREMAWRARADRFAERYSATRTSSSDS